MRISWKHDDTYLSGEVPLDKMIDVFEAQMWGWQLHVADLIINGGRNHEDNAEVNPIPHSAFAVLQVCLVYFEAIGKYENGDTGRDSKRLFLKGLLSVFPGLAQAPFAATQRLVQVLYEGARCGLYHLAMTAPGISVARTGSAITFQLEPERVVIDPHVLVTQLKQHFASYIARLRDPSERVLRERFEKCFNVAKRPMGGN